jgi:DNA-binding transcriptional LysR family regulator
MRELSLDRLRTLVTIVDLGSFAAAAEALHLAPPTVSLHVSELEARFGAPLLLRERGRVTPTGIGATLLEHARKLLNLADAAVEDVRRQVEGKGGRVRISAATPIIANLLPPALAEVNARYPGIEVQLCILTSQEALERVAAGTLDIGVVALPQPRIAGLQLHPWRRDPVMALVPAHWPRPARVTPAWLAARPLILNDSRTRLSRMTAEWFAAAGHHPLPRIEMNYNDAIKSLVAAGYGATLLPYEAEPAHPDPRIAIVPLRPQLWRTLGIAHRSGRLEAAVEHVLGVLRDPRIMPQAGGRIARAPGTGRAREATRAP